MSKLFCDCKTDEEKSNFFLSGKGVETGIIAPAISNEVAMAFHRCFEFEKQLAACERQRDELKADAERYQELLYAVQRKFPNESRHETALRYIKHAEAPSYSNAAKESK